MCPGSSAAVVDTFTGRRQNAYSPLTPWGGESILQQPFAGMRLPFGSSLVGVTSVALEPGTRSVVPATLSTPLEGAGRHASGRRLPVKRDDLTGLGIGEDKLPRLDLLRADTLACSRGPLAIVGAEQIQAKVQARIDVGVEYLMLHTLTADPAQLELIAEHVIEPFGGAR